MPNTPKLKYSPNINLFLSQEYGQGRHSLLVSDNSGSLEVFFPNISGFKVEESPIRGKIITQIFSENEVLKLTTYTQLPGACCYLPDTICSDVLTALKNYQEQAAEFMKSQQFDKFLDTLPY